MAFEAAGKLLNVYAQWRYSVQSFNLTGTSVAAFFGNLSNRAEKSGVCLPANELARGMLNNGCASGATENGQSGRLRRSEKITEQR